MSTNDVSEYAARFSGHIGNFLSHQYWVAWRTSEFENMIQDCVSHVISVFFGGRKTLRMVVSNVADFRAISGSFVSNSCLFISSVYVEIVVKRAVGEIQTQLTAQHAATAQS